MLRAGEVAVSESASFWRSSDEWWTQGGLRGARIRGKAEKLRVSDRPGSRVFAAMPDSAQWYYQDPQNQKGLVRQGPGLAQSLLELVRSLDADLAVAYDKHLGELASYAFREWPVSSGLSKAMLELTYVSAGGKFIGRINSRAPYTFYINSKPWKLYLDRGFSTTVAIANDALNKVGGGRGGNRG
jgi:hypothetical protein